MEKDVKMQVSWPFETILRIGFQGIYHWSPPGVLKVRPQIPQLHILDNSLRCDPRETPYIRTATQILILY